MPFPPKTYKADGAQIWREVDKTLNYQRAFRLDGPAFVLPQNEANIDRPTTECKWLTADGLVASLYPNIESMRYYGPLSKLEKKRG